MICLYDKFQQVFLLITPLASLLPQILLLASILSTIMPLLLFATLTVTIFPTCT